MWISSNDPRLPPIETRIDCEGNAKVSYFVILVNPTLLFVSQNDNANNRKTLQCLFKNVTMSLQFIVTIVLG